jgi:hypothetical protein
MRLLRSHLVHPLFAAWSGRGSSVGRYYGNGQSFVFTFAGDRSAFNAWRSEQLERDADMEHAAIIATLQEHHHAPHFAEGIDAEPLALPPSIFAGPSPVASGSTTGAHSGPLNVYRWSRRNKYFQLAGPDGIGMGGGGSFAWFLDADLEKGACACCSLVEGLVLARGSNTHG